MSQNLYEVYNNTFNEIQKDYLYIFSNGSRLENYLIQNIKNNSKDEIEDDGEGEINISLAKSASKIDFDVEVPYETMAGTPIRDLIRSA